MLQSRDTARLLVSQPQKMHAPAPAFAIGSGGWPLSTPRGEAAQTVSNGAQQSDDRSKRVSVNIASEGGLGAADFSIAERDRRWLAIRRAMSDAGVDYMLAVSEMVHSEIGLGRPADARYLLNDSGSVIFPLEGDPIWFAPMSRDQSVIGDRGAPKEPWVSDMRPAAGPDDPVGSAAPTIARALSEMRIGNKRVAICGLSGGGPYTMVRTPDGQVNHTTLIKLLAAVPDGQVVDGTRLVGEARYIKSNEEIACLRLSERMAEKQVEVLVARCRPGTPLSQLYAELTAVAQSAGFAVSRQMLAAGPWGETWWRSQEYGATPTIPLQPGWIVKNELEPQVFGYSAQVAQPLILGPSTAEQRELFALGKQAFEVALSEMKPGVTWREVWTKVVSLGTSKLTVEFLMHGRGLGDDGPLYVPIGDQKTNPSNNDEIRENTVFVLKPFARRSNDPRSDWAVARTLTWGDSVVITPTGAQRLGTRPLELHVT